MSGHGECVSSVTPYTQRIPRKNKRKKTSENLNKENDIIQELDNPSKRAKEDSIPDVEKQKNTTTV